MTTRYEVLSSTNGPLIGMQVDMVHNDVRATILRQVIDTTDASLRAALVKIGWTPPETSPVPA